MSDELILKRLRAFLLGFCIFIFAGTIIELWAIDHTQEALQYFPFILCALGIILAALMLIMPTQFTISLLRVGMWIIFVGGIIGMAVHVAGNLDSVGQYNQGTDLLQIIKMGLSGGNPFLAPGIISMAAVMALAGAYKHPNGK